MYCVEGNTAYKEKDYLNAVHFFTEGIAVKCKDVQLNAKLHSNRATANYYLGKI